MDVKTRAMELKANLGIEKDYHIHKKAERGTAAGKTK